MNDKQDMASLKCFLRDSVYILREHYTHWHSIKFGHNKTDVEQLAYCLHVLGKVIGISDNHILNISRNHFLQR